MTDADQRVTLGAAQVAEVFMDRDATVEKDVDYIEQAGELGIDLLAFPEFHIPTSPRWHSKRFENDLIFEEYYRRLFENAVVIPGETTEKLCEAAKAAGTAVVIGVNEKVARTAGTMYNTLVFIDSNGELLGKRRKLNPTRDERLFHSGGTGEDMRLFDSSMGNIGGLMCGEHANPLAQFANIGQGEEIHVAAWPAFPEKSRDERDIEVNIRTRNYALSAGAPTISATGVVDEALAKEIGDPNVTPDSGASSIIGPNGKYLAGPKWEGEGIVSADVDMSSRIESKATIDVMGHYNRFDIFDFTINKRSQNPVSTVDE